MAVTIHTGGKGPAKAARVPSTVQFPYTDMSDAIQVAEGCLKGGGTPLSRDQLAAAIGLASGGGGFATKIATARVFGVIDSVGGRYQLTDIGHEIVDPSRRSGAMIEAFLNVELYKRVYDEFRGKRLPPRPHGLEAAFVNMGVSPKNAKPARLAFDKSARMAGFFPSGEEDRLVMPFGVATGSSQAEDDPVEPKPILASQVFSTPARAFAGGGPMLSEGATIHPSIIGMVQELPPAKSEWSMAEQADWLQALATMFRVIYKGGDHGTISVTVVRNTALHAPPKRALNLDDDL